jgi:hypothetical protein
MGPGEPEMEEERAELGPLCGPPPSHHPGVARSRDTELAPLWLLCGMLVI